MAILENHWQDVDIAKLVASLPPTASLYRLSTSLTSGEIQWESWIWILIHYFSYSEQSCSQTSASVDPSTGARDTPAAAAAEGAAGECEAGADGEISVQRVQEEIYNIVSFRAGTGRITATLLLCHGSVDEKLET